MKIDQETAVVADNRVIEKAKEGDRRAFSEIVRRYEDLVFSFSFKVCRDKEKAEETVQDTFVNVYRKLRQFDGKSKFTTWLYSIVVNNCLMKRRKSKLRQATVSIDTPEGFRSDPLRDGQGNVIQTIPSWKETPDVLLMKKELQELLDRAIQQLPVDYRIVFVLRDIEGKSAEETAKIMRLSIPAVKSRLHRARAFLREQLHDYMKP